MIVFRGPLTAFALSILMGIGQLSAAEQDEDAGAAGRVAADFINEHISSPPGYEETIARVEASPLVTERYKTALTKLYRDALKEAPDYGYGADAVVGGQEHPDRMRVKTSKVEGDRARVVLIGEEASFPMEVKVDLVRQDGRWLVDASGDLIED